MSDCRINVSRHVKDKLLPKIDDSGFFALSKEFCERAELFLMAMAMNSEGRVKSANTVPISLVRTESMKSRWVHVLYITYLSSFAKIGQGVNDLADHSEKTICDYCSQMADVGFAEIEQLMGSTPECVADSLTVTMNEQYNWLKEMYPMLDLPALDDE